MAACERVDAIRRITPLLKEKLLEAGQEQLFDSLELPLITILAEMEYRGILVDAHSLELLAGELEKAMGEKAAKIYDLAKEEFNIHSPKQLASILFDKLALPVVKKTKSGPSTDSSVLEELVVAHPIAELVLNYRTLAKLKGTYAEVLPRLIHPRTQRIHTFFNQAVTATGRLSSSEPNLQNIPIRSEEGRKIREAFIPSPGHILLSADYSQIELRILAHFSKDEHLLEAFHTDGDVHRQTAAEMYNLPQHEVTPEMRRQAKTINFGIIYGMGAFGLARRLGISRQMAKGVIERYFERYRGVRNYIDTVVEAARKLGYTETILGRRRPLPELSSRNHNIRQQGERLAINSPIQGSAADLIKKAMIEVARALKEKELSTAMLLQVHDELVFEVPVGELEAARELILKRMEQVAEPGSAAQSRAGVGRITGRRPIPKRADNKSRPWQRAAFIMQRKGKIAMISWRLSLVLFEFSFQSLDFLLILVGFIAKLSFRVDGGFGGFNLSGEWELVFYLIIAQVSGHSAASQEHQRDGAGKKVQKRPHKNEHADNTQERCSNTTQEHLHNVSSFI